MKNLAAIFICLSLAAPSIAGIIYVDANGTGDYPTIQAAINYAVNGDTVLVADGTYTGSGNRDLDFTGKAVTLCSENGPDITIIDCEGEARGFYFKNGEDADSVVRGFTITRGSARRGAQKYGGGIKCVSSSPTIANCIFYGCIAECNGGGIYCTSGANPLITDCIFTSNSAPGIEPDKEHHYGKGGGIYCAASSPLITNCIIEKNSAKRGAGVFGEVSGNPVIRNCTLICNNAERGGGMYFHLSTPEITYCTIEENSTSGSGGGLYCYNINSTISHCTFRANFCGGGGAAVYCYLGAPEITSSLITGNGCYCYRFEEAEPGGGIHCRSANPTISNCTIVGNYAGAGGGIYCKHNTIIRNSILWLNKPDQVHSTHESPQVAYCTIQDGYPGYYNIDSDPCFAAPGFWIEDEPTPFEEEFWIEEEDADYHLKSQAGRWDPNNQGWVKDDVTSPCIDAGNPMSPIGPEPFPNGGIVNMGAYGRTTEASKSYFDKPPCEIIIAGDINGDCEINFKDFWFIGLHWLREY